MLTGTRSSARQGLALLPPLFLAACAQRPPAQVPTRPARSAASEAGQRKALSLTVYNQNFGLIRERRLVSLGEGLVELEYRDVARELEPNTVSVRSLGKSSDLSVLEQNYRYDLLSPKTLLEKHVGEKIKIYRYDEKLGTEQVKEAEIVAAENGVVLRVDGQLTYELPGRFAFPKLPDDLVAKPTLVWLVQSGAPEQELEVSYLTRGLNWSADYVVKLDASDKKADLNGWVTLTNESGTSFEAAQLKLVAGDVQRVAPLADREEELVRLSSIELSKPPAPAFQEESLLDYHLYTLDRPTSVKDKEKKQVALLEAHDVQVTKKLVLRGTERYFLSRHGTVSTNQRLDVMLELENAKKNQLGMPLPQGTLRVYKADTAGGLQFVGEDRIDHTPRDEKVKVRLGQAFDVVADRKQLQYTQLFQCVSESEWEIEIRNHKDTAEAVQVWEPVSGDWEVVRSTLPSRREDSRHFVFDLNVPARGKANINYRVRVRWC
ncbi:MAG: DUF4139 domain-containing protein [Myxococcota bacterium]|nr:DUF4139 domain-containing protein [Myxococcota bacterium]